MLKLTEEFKALPEDEKAEKIRKVLTYFGAKASKEPDENTRTSEVVAAQAENLEIAKSLGLKPAPSPRDVAREMEEMAGVYPLTNLAVEVCCSQFSEMFKKQSEAGAKPEVIQHSAKLAYCTFLPKLSSRVEISDFIACVTHAMAVGILPGAEGTRLIYAAQVASTSLPSPKARKQQRKTPQNHIPVPAPTPAETTI